MSVQAVKGDHVSFGETKVVDMIDEVDVVLMRQDPPFDMAYITATHFLEKVHPHTLVVNNPAEVRNAPEKLFVTDFPGVQPPTLITSDVDAIYDFRERHGDMVLKPLHGGGGSGVVRLKADDPNLDALLELLYLGLHLGAAVDGRDGGAAGLAERRQLVDEPPARRGDVVREAERGPADHAPAAHREGAAADRGAGAVWP